MVVQDDAKNIMALGVKHLVSVSNSEAKCVALVEAIQMGLKLGVRKLHLEGDSQIMVNEIIKGEL